MSMHVVRRVVGPSILPRERLGFVENNLPVLPEACPSAGANSSSYGTWKHQTRAQQNPQNTKCLRRSFCSCFSPSLRSPAYANNPEFSSPLPFTFTTTTQQPAPHSTCGSSTSCVITISGLVTSRGFPASIQLDLWGRIHQ